MIACCLQYVKDSKFESNSQLTPKNCNVCPFNTGERDTSPRDKASDCVNCPYMRAITVTDKRIRKAREEYESFGKEWKRDMFNDSTGGYLVTHSDRVGKSRKSKNESEKFDKEHTMCVNLVRAGYKVRLLKDGGPFGDCDITVDGVLADLKKMGSPRQIESYASDTFGKKKGKVVVFELESRKAIMANAIEGVRLTKGQKMD